ncbi:MAG: hypothetical protein QXK76_03745 [Candidatus Woesearchaeota archaeon]
MENSDLRIKILETFYDLAVNNNLDSLRNLRKYLININEDIEGIFEYELYRKTIDKITFDAFFNRENIVDDKKLIECYKIIEKYSRQGKIYYGGKK